MPMESAHPDGRTARSWGWTLVSVAVLAAAALLAWSNTFQSPFVFDDNEAIVTNYRLQHFWPPWRSAWAPRGITLSGRPVAAFTFALNHAAHGLSLPGYHAVNLLIHALSALALFGVVRRTLRLESMRERFEPAVTPIALVCALLWLLHPLQTESVTYIVQRVESLTGLFYLLTLYCAIRGFSSSTPGWAAASVAACALGMGTKEVAVTAPVIVLVYDRIFVSGTFAKALRARPRFYGALAATWVVELALLAVGGSHDKTVGFGLPGMSSTTYVRYQIQAVLHYLVLAFRPYPLILDYGRPMPPTWLEIVPSALLLASLLTAALWAFLRRLPSGFLGVWFFLILAPTSSVVPIVAPISEHRMYLPLAGVVTGVTVFVFLSARRVVRWVWSGRAPAAASIAGAVIALVAAGLLGGLTYSRNEDYRTELLLWTDNVTKLPGNERAWASKGNSLNALGRYAEAIACFDNTLKINSRYAPAWSNKSYSLNSLGRYQEALGCCDRAIEINPRIAEAWNNKGKTLNDLRRYQEALACCDEALQLDPLSAEAWVNKGVSLYGLGRYPEAIPCYEKAVEIHPRYAVAWRNKAAAHEALGDGVSAIRCLRTYLEWARTDPGERTWIPKVEAHLRNLQSQ